MLLAEGLVLKPPGSGLGGTSSLSKQPSPRCPLLTVDLPWQEDQKHKPADASHTYMVAGNTTGDFRGCKELPGQTCLAEGRSRKSQQDWVTTDPRADHRG